VKVIQGHRHTQQVVTTPLPAVWLLVDLFRVIDQSVAVELAEVHVSPVSRSNGIIQWTNCKLEWVYRDPVAWNPHVDPSF